MAGVLLCLGITSCGDAGDTDGSGVAASSVSTGDANSPVPEPSSGAPSSQGFPDAAVCSLVPAETISRIFEGKRTRSSPVKDAHHELCRWHQAGRKYESIEVKVWRPLSSRAIADSAEQKITVKGRPVYRVFSSSHRCELDADMSGYFVGVTRRSYDTVSCERVTEVLGHVIEAVSK